MDIGTPLRSIAVLVLLIGFLFVQSLPNTNASFGPCCEYAFIVSDTQPSPGERVDFIGAVTDQFGGGEANVSIRYQDSYGGNSSIATTDLTGSFYLSHTMPLAGYSNPIRFTITFIDNASAWNGTVVDSFPPPSSSPSGDHSTLYYSLVNGRSIAYVNVHSLGRPAVIYLGGGYEQPILHGDNSLDQATKGFLDALAGSGFNVIAPIGWFVQDTPTFPFVLAAMLKYGLQMGRVYLVGWSAGGTVAAWTLTRDLHHIFDLGVIMDAELTGAINQTSTNPQVFNTLQSAASAKIPHLLVWGISDASGTSIQSAMRWARQNDFSRLDAFAYSHQWLGSTFEHEVVTDIAAFFSTGYLGARNNVQLGNTTLHTQSNSQLNLSSVSYDSQRKAYSFEISGQDGTIGSLSLVIPTSSISGQPVVLIDGDVTSNAYLADTGNYYIYLTYGQSSHKVLVAGQNTVPEFATDSPVSQIALLISIVTIGASARRRRNTARKFSD